MKELALFQAGLIGEVYSNRNVPDKCGLFCSNLPS